IAYGLSVVGQPCNQPVATPAVPLATPTPGPTAVPLPSVAPGTNSTAQTALPIAPGGTSSTLPGKSAGSLAFYSFNYPGDNSNTTITLKFSPADGFVARGAG